MATFKTKVHRFDGVVVRDNIWRIIHKAGQESKLMRMSCRFVKKNGEVRDMDFMPSALPADWVPSSDGGNAPDDTRLRELSLYRVYDVREAKNWRYVNIQTMRWLKASGKVYWVIDHPDQLTPRGMQVGNARLVGYKEEETWEPERQPA